MKKYSLFAILSAFALLLAGCGEKKQEDPRAVLRINTKPQDAEVVLLGKPQGKTPFGCRIPAGPRLLKLSKPGYETVWKIIELKPRQKLQLTEVLKQQSASVLFQTTPAGATVIMDGKELGVTPFSIRELPIGKYSATLKLSGYTRRNVEWEISDARPRMIQTVLQSNVGTLSVKSLPKAALVYLDEQDVGRTPYSGSHEQGRYTLRIQSSGYTAYQQTVSIRRNKTTEVNVKLNPLPGALSITTEPVNALIRINGKDYGAAPVTVKNLPVGKYTVTAARSGYDTETVQLDLPAGEKLSHAFSMKVNTGGIDFATYPAGITVYLDGKELGATIPDGNSDNSKVFSVRGLKPGMHTLQLAHKHARPNRKTVKVNVAKGEIKRLDTQKMWIANTLLKLKSGEQIHGRLISQSNKSVIYEPEPGVTYSYKREDIESITPMKREE